MVAGLEDVSGGEIEIDGRVVNEVAPKDRQLAMVFQNYALYPHMTVRQNMRFALKPQKLPAVSVEQKINEVAAMLGLEALLERKPAQLSGGQRQRVAMGRAMVRTPRVFLFDEPLSNLDAKLRTQVRIEIAKLHKQLGTTVLYVTHDQIEAMTLADRIVIMRDGYIEQVGSPEEVFAHPRNVFVATFIGSPAMNLLAATVETQQQGGAYMLSTGSIRIPAPADKSRHLQPGRKLTLGVRPSDIQLAGADTDNTPAAIDASVEVTEYLGTEALLDIRAGEHELIAQVPAAQRPKSDERIRIRFNPAALHIFDAATGAAL
jgi:multiple sugar transport system ATP-binding protein